MAAFVDLLGDVLVDKSGNVPTKDALEGKAAVALYFSAHWCPPCKGFTPKLAEWYTNNLKAKGLAVVFVSGDRDEDTFKEYYGQQPWLALPYEAREKERELSKKFKVTGIPSLVILDGAGKTISKDGRAAVSQDPTGEDFPWKPKSFKEIFDGAKLLKKIGEECNASELEGKVLGLYFSAHWCPPCKGFTPSLAEWYSKDLHSKGLEIVFVSSDHDEESFKEYFKEQPWLALDYADRKRKNQLSSLFGVRGIPSLVIIDKDGFTITKEGRQAVTDDPTATNFPWYPKPVGNLKSGPGRIKEVPTTVIFCEASDEQTQNGLEDMLIPIAKQYQDEAKAAGEEDPPLSFVMATQKGGLASRIRQMVSLPCHPPDRHEHPLEQVPDGGGWQCDGCGKSGSSSKKRCRCTLGCDFDFCEECNNSAGKSAPQPPRMALLDIPDNGGYYVAPEGEITADSLAKFIQDFKGKVLQRQQLSD